MADLFRVYIDETGDRGTAPGASPFFAFAALVVRDVNDVRLREAHADWCKGLGKPPGTFLHWRDNLKSHAQRKYVTERLGALPVRLTFVVVDKASLAPTAYVRANADAMYLWSARLLLERISWLMDAYGGEAILTFGEVRGFEREKLDRYLRILREQHTSIHWNRLRPNVRIAAARRSVGVQLADIAVGALDAAIRPQVGTVEPMYLVNLRRKIYRKRSNVLSYGLKVVGDDRFFPSLPWWREFTRPFG